MTLAELVEEKTEALRVRDVARILDVSVKQNRQNGSQRPNPFTADREYRPFRSSRIRFLAQDQVVHGVIERNFVPSRRLV